MRHILKLGALLALPATTFSHTWLDAITNTDDDGIFIGPPGFPRMFVPRGEPDIDRRAVWQLPASLGVTRPQLIDSDPLCRYFAFNDSTVASPKSYNETQNKPNSNLPEWPQLQTKPGQYVTFRYTENGHVTAPQTKPNKPGSGGLVYVYATTSPSEDEKALNVLKWTPTGDLSKGRLLAINTYDDGQCYQVRFDTDPASGGKKISFARQVQFPNQNLSPGQKAVTDTAGFSSTQDDPNTERLCSTNIRIPDDTPLGQLTLYWVWQWPTFGGADEVYTSCSDVKILDKSTDLAAMKVVDPSHMPFPDPNTHAVPNFKDRAANLTFPDNKAFYGPDSGAGTGVSTAPAPPASSASLAVSPTDAPPTTPSAGPGAFAQSNATQIDPSPAGTFPASTTPIQESQVAGHTSATTPALLEAPTVYVTTTITAAPASASFSSESDVVYVTSTTTELVTATVYASPMTTIMPDEFDTSTVASITTTDSPSGDVSTSAPASTGEAATRAAVKRWWWFQG